MTLCSAAHHPSIPLLELLCLLSTTDSANIRSLLIVRLLLLVTNRPRGIIIARDWVLLPATCWFCVLKSNLCFCQMFVCPTNCDHVDLLDCSTIIILILWILCRPLVSVCRFTQGCTSSTHPTKTVLVINYYNYLLQLFTLSILCLSDDDGVLTGIQFAFPQVFAGGWHRRKEWVDGRLHLNTLLECIQSFSRAASMQFLINGALVLQHKCPLNDAGDTQRKVFSWPASVQTVLHYISGVSGNPIQVRLLLLC